MAKFCTNCGAGLDEAAKFCAACGTQTAGETPPPPPPMPQPISQQPYAPAPPPAKKKHTGLKVFLGIFGGLLGVVALIFAVAAAATGSAAKKDYYELGNDKIPSVKLALGEKRKVTNVQTSQANGEIFCGYQYEASAWKEDMTAYVSYLLSKDDFYILPEEEGAFAVLGRNSVDEGQRITLIIVCDDTGYAVTVFKDAGQIEPAEPNEEPAEPEQTTAPPQNTAQAQRTVDMNYEWENEILELGDQCLELLKNKDWGALGSLVHREQGLTFSPYGYVEDDAQCFGVGDVKALDYNEGSRVWGYYDGSGNPIEMTFEEYYDRFIFDKDFTQAPQVAVNKVVRTTMQNNLYVFGNGCEYIDYHVPGGGEMADHAWASLRLVFGGYENELYLVAVVHDEWTI